MILDAERNLTLRPMAYPNFFQAYKNAIANTWSVDDLDFSGDIEHLRDKITPQETHLIKRLVAFFASADNLVAENLILNFYKSINSPEYRMFLSRQIYEEALHIETYLLLVDTYIKDDVSRKEAFDAYKLIPSIAKKADFMLKYMDVDSKDKSKILENIICFACCVEGLFFFGSFAYVYFLRSKGLLPGLATATDYIFRDETLHIETTMQVVDTIRAEYPILFGSELETKIRAMIQEALDCEIAFCEEALSGAITGINGAQMAQYLQYVADNRLVRLGYKKQYNVTNPFPFMVLQDVKGLGNFFEVRITEYSRMVSGKIVFDEIF